MFNELINSLQNGTIRTNCMDCLDRTNLVQTLIALKVRIALWWGPQRLNDSHTPIRNASFGDLTRAL